jgi:predicted amidohydrolase
MTPYTVAVAQMNTQDDRDAALSQAAQWVAEAAGNGASLIAFPETMNYMGRGYREHAEPIPGPTSDRLCALAKEHHIWIQGGSITEAVPDENPRNTALLISPAGEIVCRYSKLHMFDVVIQDGPSYRESAYSTAGQGLTVARTPLGVLGLSICYDLRFCELYRLLAMAGAQVLFVPSSFTMNTGKDHWEPLLRARAIENGCYVVAPSQIGKKAKMQAYGKSMVIDPWGNVIAQASDRPELIYARIDLDYIDNVRRQVPSLDNRRGDLYRLDCDYLTVVDAL